MNISDDKTTRRAALRQMAGTAAAAGGVLPILGQNPPPENHHSAQPVTKTEAAYKYRFFSPAQLKTLDALGETIIPADEHSPGAKAARVSEYIDAIVSDAPEYTKKRWRDGLAQVERAAEAKFQLSYDRCSQAQQTAIVQEMAGEEDPKRRRADDFFSVLKRATIDGYYTSKIGMFQDLQYVGNQAMPGFPGCQHGEPGASHS